MKKVNPVCPSLCRYRLLCPLTRQRGINQLFIEGVFTRAEECIAYEGFGAKLRKEYGIELTGTDEDIFYAVEERIGIQSE